MDLSEFSKKRILVVGDICLDRYVVGDVVYGSSREGEDLGTLRYLKGKQSHKDEYSPGAGGNLAQNLASLGAKVSVLGVVGEDYKAYILKRELQKRGIDSSMLVVSDSRGTITFEKFYDVKDQTTPIGLRADTENEFSMGKETEFRLIKTVESKYKEYDAIIAIDHCEVKDRTAIITEEILSLLASFKGQKKTFGSSRNRISKFKNFYCLVPNDNELVRATKTYRVSSFEEEVPFPEIEKASKIFYKKNKPEHLLVTRGKKGAFLYDNEGMVVVLTTPLTENIDITGCGDTFLATLTLADLSGLSKYEAVNLANIAAGIIAKKLGTTGTATIEEILEAKR